MPSINDLKEEVFATWAALPAAEVCVQIIDYVASLMPNQAEMLTFSTLCHATRKRVPDIDLITAIAILSNSKLDVLDAHALFVDGSLEHEITQEELSDARISGELVHPITGNMVRDFESHIIPFFVPTQRFRDYVK